MKYLIAIIILLNIGATDLFYARVQDIWIEFFADSNGKVIKMISIQGGSKIEAKKIEE